MNQPLQPMNVVLAMCLNNSVWRRMSEVPGMPGTKINDMMLVNEVLEVVAQDQKDLTKIIHLSVFPPQVSCVLSAGPMATWNSMLADAQGEDVEELDEVHTVDQRLWRVGGPVPGNEGTVVTRIVRSLGSHVVEVFVLPTGDGELANSELGLHFLLMPLTILSAKVVHPIARGLQIAKLLKEMQEEEDVDEDDDDDDYEDDEDEKSDDVVQAINAAVANGTPAPSPAPSSTTPNENHS